MAYVTFLIGNGLDLSLGLATKYQDFYDYVKHENLHPENRIYKAIAESQETWADFEKALGEYTAYIEPLDPKDLKNESVNFHEELEEFRIDLATYLSAESKKASDKIGFIKLQPHGFLKELKSGNVPKLVDLLKNGNQIYQFVTLNYTNTLESILKSSSPFLQANGIRLASNRPLHLHGDTMQDMTLGVSDETQLSSSLTGAEKDDLIKPSLIYSMNDGRIEELNELINRTSVLILYGTSIGETDKYIWQIVSEWLAGSKARYIIIYKYDASYNDSVRLSSRKQKQFTSSAQEKLLRFSGKDGDVIEELRSRIFVVHNTKQLFSTK